MTEKINSKLDFSQFLPAQKYPQGTEFVRLIEKFQNLHISIKDITNEEQHKNHQKVVEVTYSYNGKSYVTKPLYYKNLLYAPDVKKARDIISYFGDEIYWLDIEVHDWPKPSGETDIDNLVVNDITDNEDFKSLLKQIANNAGTGWIQRITQQGRSSQYYRNLENNNHWHDLVLLIQEAINKAEIHMSFFKPLVFKWDGNKNTDRLRSSLSPHFGSRALIDCLVDNVNNYRNLINKKNMINDITEILRYKKQIILQGPPGTGKTRMAKEIAKGLLDIGGGKIYQKPNQINVAILNDRIKKGVTFRSVSDYADYEVTKVNDASFTVKTHTTGSEYNASFKNIIKYYKDELWSKPGVIKWGNDPYVAATAKYIHDTLDFEEVAETFENTERLRVLQFHPSYTYEDFVRGISTETKGENIVYQAKNRVLVDMANKAAVDLERIYVIILDEINRANLSSVLGELIYALEYRDDQVESIYNVNGSNKISLPSNLYIIGTMNTADRSVGHIDYAIRRRFAFVDIPPEKLTDTDVIWFNTLGYERVEKLFDKANVSNEFNAKDIQLGHSYFIVTKTPDIDVSRRDQLFKLKMDYEIKPILREYVKDGILVGQIETDDVLDYIDKL
jgi:MoxR-like ATPase